MFRGHVDLVGPTLVSGWAVDTDRPDETVEVSIFVDGRKLVQLACNSPREDLKGLAGLGNGMHGFRYNPYPPLSERMPQRVTVRHATSGALLGNGDVVLNAETATTPLDLVRLLLAAGAKVDARLTAAALQRNHTPGEPLLGVGTTALMRAARNGDAAVMQVLVAAGADASLAQPNGTTVLMLACGVGRGLGVFAKDVGSEADLLQGARVVLGRGVDVNAANAAGMTAVHYAAQAGLDSLVRELARHGARLDAKDKQARTPMDVALGVGNRGRAGGPPALFPQTAALLKDLMAAPAAR